MTIREEMIENGENLGWCKPYVSERVKFVLYGDIVAMEIDGIDFLVITEEDVKRAARIVNEYYDDYSGWDATHILLEGDVKEVGCAECPWFDVCDAMNDE